jgi:hypothetical protein
MATPKKVSRLMQILEQEGFMTSTGKRYTPPAAKKKAAANQSRLTGGQKAPKTGAKAESTLKKFAGKQPSTSTTAKPAPKAKAPAKAKPTPKAASKTTNPGGPASLGKKLTPAQRREREKAISTKEGATKTVGGVRYKYIRGEWQRVKRNGFPYG